MFGDNELVKRIRAGDQQALAIIHAEYYTRLLRYAERITGSADTARDIVQDVFLNLWEKRASWIVKRSIVTYLYASIRGTALRTLRHDRVVSAHESHVAEQSFAVGGLFGTASPEDDAEAAELLSLVNRVLESLPPRCREAFTLYKENGLELEEVASVMGTSVGTVKVQLRRAAAALREALTPHLGE